MWVKKLELENFRNYRHQSVELAPGLNLVAGRNAQGKTNLLEAIYCLCGFGSPRTPDSALIREGEDAAFLHAGIESRGRDLTIDLEFKSGRGTRALVNKAPLGRGRALSEVLVAVFFGPDELSLVKGSPEGRRRFLDELVVKLRPGRVTLRRSWEKAFRQRNALLREWPVRGRVPDSLRESLEVWNETYARAGAALAAARLEALRLLAPYARARYRAIAGGGDLGLELVSSWVPEAVKRTVLEEPVDEASLYGGLMDRLLSLRQREIERGSSLVGPQRDDVNVTVSTPSGDGSFDARTHASQGDQRTTALALKLAEHDLLTEELGEPPVLLLDDVFSELDPQRRAWLRDSVSSGGQTLVSSAELEEPRSVGAERVLSVAKGEVEVLV